MSLFREYIRELAGKDVLETEYGFCSYKITHDECYLEDVYVIPSKRKSGYGSSLANKVIDLARDRGCKWVTTSISSENCNPHPSLLAILGFGMKLKKIDKNMAYFYKGIK